MILLIERLLFLVVVPLILVFIGLKLRRRFVRQLIWLFALESALIVMALFEYARGVAVARTHWGGAMIFLLLPALFGSVPMFFDRLLRDSSQQIPSAALAVLIPVSYLIGICIAYVVVISANIAAM